MVSRRRIIRVNTKFYVLIAAVAAAVGLLLFFFLHTESAVVSEGSLQFDMTLTAVVVRDEEVITTGSYEKVNYLVPDLQRVEADTAVAEIYRWGYNENVMNDVIDVQNRIEQYELEHGSVTQEVVSLNEQISEAAAAIREIAAGGEGDMAEAELKLTNLMDQKWQALSDSAGRDTQLEALYAQEQQLMDRVNSWREVSDAPKAGVVSYYYDGYESVINAGNLRNVNAAVIDALIAGTLQVAAEEEEARPLYRLVDNFSWYIVVHPPSRVPELANDNVFAVTFENYPDRAFEGRVIGNISEGSTYLYVLEFSEDIGSLVNVRRTEATLRATFEGLVVPEAAISESGGEQGVYVLENRVRTFVPVDVRITKDGEAVVAAKDGSSRLAAGSRVTW